MGLTKLLFHTGFREMAFQSLESLFVLKTVGLKEIVLVYVIPSDEVAFVPYGGYRQEEEDRIREEAEIRFKDWVGAIEAQGLTGTIRIERGIVNARVLAAAEETSADLIVTGRKKRNLLERVYVGGHTLDLIRRSPVPIMVGKYMVSFEWAGETLSRENAAPFQRPMVATDWSDASGNAARFAATLKGLAEKVLVVHNIGERLSRGAEVKELRRLESESRDRLDAVVRQLIDAGVDAEAHLSVGRTVPEILRTAREYDATSVIMGRTGKDWLHEYWLGGVSHRVTEMSELPVMLVP